jgi:glutamyl-tRNA synthetase
VSELVRTRFAPSPTGYLHIGGARTALFNYLLARRLGGRFVLRIEDTDQTRNVPDADRKLLEDLRWLGLQWDEGPLVGGPAGPYHQSERLEIYREHARRLLDAGQAYYAFETREELAAMRAAAQREKRNFRYPRPVRFPSEDEARRAREAGRPVVVRFRMPEQEFIVRDAILGEVRIGPDEVDDFVILKADGWPTYHFAVVVDDELMGITHVLRGQEHLMNTPNHLGLQQAFGFRTPLYAHLPIILNPDGSKMGKRRNNESVRAALTAALAAGSLDENRARELADTDARKSTCPASRSGAWPRPWA